MDRDQAQAKAEELFQRGPIEPFVYQIGADFIVGTYERGGGRVRNHREIGRGASWEAALNSAIEAVL